MYEEKLQMRIQKIKYKKRSTQKYAQKNVKTEKLLLKMCFMLVLICNEIRAEIFVSNVD
jgi:hypothetical protein